VLGQDPDFEAICSTPARKSPTKGVGGFPPWALAQGGEFPAASDAIRRTVPLALVSGSASLAWSGCEPSLSSPDSHPLWPQSFLRNRSAVRVIGQIARPASPAFGLWPAAGLAFRIPFTPFRTNPRILIPQETAEDAHPTAVGYLGFWAGRFRFWVVPAADRDRSQTTVLRSVSPPPAGLRGLNPRNRRLSTFCGDSGVAHQPGPLLGSFCLVHHRFGKCPKARPRPGETTIAVPAQ
jgi:hypothetical protein